MILVLMAGAVVPSSVQGVWADDTTLVGASPYEVFPGETASCQYAIRLSSAAGTEPLHITQVQVLLDDWGYVGTAFSGDRKIGSYPHTWTFNHSIAMPADLAPGPHSGKLKISGSAEGDAYEINRYLDFTYVCASSALQASIAASTSTGQAPVDVTLTGDVTGGTAPYTYSWRFDDGGTGTGGTVTHTYAQAGTYSPVLVVKDLYNRTVSKTSAGIEVSPPFQVGVNVSTSAGTTPLSVNFTASPRYGSAPYTYLWRFGDGSTSNEASPTHVYQGAGTYGANLTMVDNNSRVASSATVRIIASLTLDLKAHITSSVSYGKGPLEVQFSSAVENATGMVTYNWTLGDGTYSSEEEPLHTYLAPGIYPVQLSVTDSSGKEVRSQEMMITVTSEDGLQVNIQQRTDNGSAPFTVPFTSTIVNGTGPYFYHWNFDDGSTSTSQEVNHTFADPGTYTVTLTVTDSSARVSISNELTVVVGEPRWAPFSTETWIWVGWGASIAAVGAATLLLIRFKW